MNAATPDWESGMPALRGSYSRSSAILLQSLAVPVPFGYNATEGKCKRKPLL